MKEEENILLAEKEQQKHSNKSAINGFFSYAPIPSTGYVSRTFVIINVRPWFLYIFLCRAIEHENEQEIDLQQISC